MRVLETLLAKDWMKRLGGLALVMSLLCACSPAYNWREVRVDGISLTVMLPCKPDHGQRDLPLVASHPVKVNMTGCKAGDATFAVAWADIGQPGDAPEALKRWKRATMQPFQSGSLQMLPPSGPGSAQGRGTEVVSASVRQADGRNLEMQGAWWVNGTQVVQAVVFAEDLPGGLPGGVTEPFFSGVALK